MQSYFFGFAGQGRINELLSRAEYLDAADIDTRHMIVSRLISRIEVMAGYKIRIVFKISTKRFPGQAG